MPSWNTKKAVDVRTSAAVPGQVLRKERGLGIPIPAGLAAFFCTDRRKRLASAVSGRIN